MTANLTSRNGGFPGAQSETVTISRRTQGANNVLSEPTFAVTTPYVNIAVDLQASTGDLYEGRVGLIPAGDAHMTVEVPVGGILPAIQDGDKVTWGTQHYLVENSYIYAFPYPHLTCILRRGSAW